MPTAIIIFPAFDLSWEPCSRRKRPISFSSWDKAVVSGNKKKEAHSHVNIIFLSPHLSSLVQYLTLKEISWRFVIFRSDLHLHYPQLVTKLLTHNHQEDITEKTVFWNSTPILLHFCFYHLSKLILLSVTIEHWMGKGIYFSKMTFIFIYYPTALSKVQMTTISSTKASQYCAVIWKVGYFVP